MGKNLTILVATILALAIAGCSSGSEEANNSNEGEEQAQKTEQQPFNNPVVAPKKNTPDLPTVITRTPNLISSTDSTERANIVAKGRKDPFARIISPIIPTAPKETDEVIVAQGQQKQQKPVPSLPPLRPKRSRVISASTGPNLKQKLSTKIANRNSKSKQATKIATTKVPKPVSVVPKTLPAVLPQPDLTSVLPPPPQPELARAVEVTGVVLVGGRAQAIIKVPSEPTSRYVSSGARLSNGVFVKRIEVNEGSDPVVILEQYGIEVAKMVGEKSTSQSIEASLNVPSPSQIATGST
ncbi:hypothetical protein [Mastigocoleus testarum]|uniref:Pilus assembly protein PilP n=1 Tax=Mastigocoleus testarum BC008 TaxID=371196 RepID=A0A0V7ZVV5_9CYAN|nr:hypothetical protein [Mastigocoleus testarum]KST68017.1 hypothetical protein BC008_32050 [Mastigocoleus testarum BC008]KST68358.1 hypothetical protein BC008_33075 [Mastigocoleus testarum BC008]